MSTPGVIEHNYTSEFFRKGIHLASLSIPVVYNFIPKSTALTILVPLTLAFLLTDVLRLTHGPVGQLYNKLFGWLLRSHERSDRGRRLTGATFVLLSACVGIWIFPKVVFITAFAILIVSDSAAALIGRRYGSTPFLKKSLEGSSAFLLSAVAVVALAPKAAYLPPEYAIGILGAAVGALAEAATPAIDDNISIPFSIGATMWLLYHTLLPSVDVFSLDKLL